MKFFILLCAFIGVYPLKLSVNTNNGNFFVEINGNKFLESAPIGFHDQNIYFSTDGKLGKKGQDKKRLVIISHEENSGEDKHGKYSQLSIFWKSDASPPVNMETRFRQYITSSAIIFTQKFVDGLNSTSLNDNNDLITAFPSFKVHDIFGKYNYLTFKDTFCEKQYGHWNELNLYRGGIIYGPIALYDKDLNTVVVSAYSNFMSSSCVRNSQSIAKNVFSCGIQGKIKSLPKGFEHSVLLYGEKGVVRTFEKWGQFIRKEYNKIIPKYVFTKDVFISHISLYTDNGSFYYYITEPGKNYEDTIIDLVTFVRDNQSIPIKGIQYDSWWYPRTKDGGLQIWEPKKEVFPDGMKKLNEIIDLPVTLHNRWFGQENDYMKMNFSFYVDSGCSLPKDSYEVYKFLMQKAKDWGMTCYEQDWLRKTFQQMSIIQEQIGIGRDWILDMCKAAEDLELNFQFCMPYPIQILQTLETGNVITHARASNDYQPRRNQWDLGFSSLLYWGLGIVPFKDNFWSGSMKQPGCKSSYKICQESNPILQTIVSVLSTGPVAFADSIGYS